MALIPRVAADDEQQPVIITFAVASTSTDRTDKFFKVPAGKRLLIDSVDYINVTGLTANASNYVDLAVKNDSTSIATRSTNTVGGSTITADTFTAFTMTSTGTNRVLAAADVLSIAIDATGTVTLPAGLLVVHGRYV